MRLTRAYKLCILILIQKDKIMKRYKQYQLLFVLFLVVMSACPAFSGTKVECSSNKNLYPVNYAVDKVAVFAEGRESEADQKIKLEEERIRAEIEDAKTAALEDVKRAELDVEKAKSAADEVKKEMELKLNEAQIELQSANNKVKEANVVAAQKVQVVKDKYSVIEDLFKKGRKSYCNENYTEAIAYFEELIAMDPQFKPAKLYLQNCVIKMQIMNEAKIINKIKIDMADIIAEFEKHWQCMKGLTIRYFFEQAQKKCQLCEYGEAEKLYSICYKINPENKKQIEWFVNATYELMDLTKQLDEHIQRVDEFASTKN